MTTPNTPLIEKGTLTREALRGRVAVVSGAGDGIGYEAARALAWLGAHVVIAEIDKRRGRKAERSLSEEMGEGIVTFVHTDVGDERSVGRLSQHLLNGVGKADIVINNATVTPVGAVHETRIQDWDRSYRVNVRGPVLLAQAFLPGMLKRKYGVFICVSSSGAAPYMGAYEAFKSAQTELAKTLAAELAGTGVFVLSIAPGFVPTTPGAVSTIAKTAAIHGQSASEFEEQRQQHAVSAEVAGAGFAAAAALAPDLHGQEITSRQALQMIGIHTY
ncbi:MAG: SDR family oxidoreductase [Firmicutes bacterium]|nr:SDR family oxidoreductase [Bacillota bacterium]